MPTHPDSPSEDTAVVARWLALCEEGGPVPDLDAFLSKLAEPQRTRVRASCVSASTALAMLGSRHETRDLRGQRLGEFELLERIGKGGSGVVYTARQASLDRTVAVKVLEVDNEDAAQRFRMEALATARIDHPRVVKLHSIGQHEGIWHIVMEWVDGHSLFDDFARRRMTGADHVLAEPAPVLLLPTDAPSARRIASFFAEVAFGLQAANEKGVTHRDVQPKNILIDREGMPKLVDFGIALIHDRTRQTQTGEAPGTLAYMSPEQLRASRSEIDVRSDVYSLGVVLYEALTGTHPFRADTAQQVIVRIARHDPAPVVRVQPCVPRDLSRICERAMEKRPADRFASAAEFADELRRCANGEPVRSRGVPLWRRGVRPFVRRPVLAAALGTAVVATTVVGLSWPTEPTASVVIERSDLAGVQVRVRRIEPLDWQVGPIEHQAVAPTQLQLPLGTWRIELVEGDAFAELTRVLEVEDAVYDVGVARLRSVVDVANGTVEVPAGSFIRGNDSQPHLGRDIRTVELGSYRIDEAEVSNRELRGFLIATNSAAPALWPDDWLYNWNVDWDELPAAGISFGLARDFAEWSGKRLPTDPEWTRAARGTDGRRLPWRVDVDRDDVLANANVGRIEGVPTLDWTARWEEYLRVAEPVRSRLIDGTALPIYHQVGNVSEWVESYPMTRPVEEYDTATPAPATGLRLTRGANWQDPEYNWPLDRVKCSRPEFNETRVGFRCAKSASLPF